MPEDVNRDHCGPDDLSESHRVQLPLWAGEEVGDSLAAGNAANLVSVVGGFAENDRGADMIDLSIRRMSNGGWWC